MPEIIRLQPDNFDYIYMHRLDAMVKQVAPELIERRGVNPGLDSLLFGAMNYAQKLKTSITEGTASAAIIENKNLHTVEGLLIVTPDVDVTDHVTGVTVMSGVCVEAVCIGSGGVTLGEMYYEGREIAASEYKDSVSGKIFAIEKTPKPVVEKRFLSMFKSEPLNAEKTRSAIGSALPQKCGPGSYRRRDTKRPTKATTEIMWLRTRI